jgi:hypothetical protein
LGEQDPPVRTAVIVLAAALILGVFGGCAEVKPWERGVLAEQAMTPTAPPRLAKKAFQDHVLDVREGSTGGYDSAGGGCGCN